MISAGRLRGWFVFIVYFMKNLEFVFVLKIQVSIRSCPLYYPGAIGFTTINGEPKVGELLDKAWTISEKCRFKILDREPKQTSSEKKNDTNDKSNNQNDDLSSIEKKDDKEDNKQEIQSTPIIGQSKSLLRFEISSYCMFILIQNRE